MCALSLFLSLLAPLAPIVPFAPFAQPEIHRTYPFPDNRKIETRSAVLGPLPVFRKHFWSTKITKIGIGNRFITFDLAVVLTVFETRANIKTGSECNPKICYSEKV